MQSYLHSHPSAERKRYSTRACICCEQSPSEIALKDGECAEVWGLPLKNLVEDAQGADVQTAEIHVVAPCEGGPLRLGKLWVAKPAHTLHLQDIIFRTLNCGKSRSVRCGIGFNAAGGEGGGADER